MTQMMDHLEHQVSQDSAHKHDERAPILFERTKQVLHQMHLLCRDYVDFVNELYPEKLACDKPSSPKCQIIASIPAAGIEFPPPAALAELQDLDGEALSDPKEEEEEERHSENNHPRTEATVTKDDLQEPENAANPPLEHPYDDDDYDAYGAIVNAATFSFGSDTDDQEPIVEEPLAEQAANAMDCTVASSLSQGNTTSRKTTTKARATHTTMMDSEPTKSQPAKKRASDDVAQDVVDFLRSDEQLYQQMLLYEVGDRVFARAPLSIF